MQFKLIVFFIIPITLIWFSTPTNSWSINGILLNWISSHSYFQKQNSNYTVCNTKSCQQTGKLFLQGLNTNIDPCDDFYEFTCGRWSISNPIPPKKLDWSGAKYSESNIVKRSLDILKSEAPSDAVSPSKLIRQFFKYCMDIAGREKAGLSPIYIIMNAVGGWPLIGNSIKSKEIKWQFIDEYYVELMRSNSIFQISVTSDYVNRSQNQIMITSAKFPRTEFFPLSTRWEGWPQTDTSYTKLVKKIAEIFLNDQHINFTKKDFDDDIHDMLEFEHKLYEMQSKEIASSKDMTTIEELQQHYDSIARAQDIESSEYNSTAKINWLKVIQELFAPWNFTINVDEKLYVPSWEFLTQLPVLFSTTKNKAIVNYIHWKFVMLMIPFTNDEMKELMNTGPDKIFVQTNDTRERDCLTEIRLTHALYREYAQKYFPKSEKFEIANMADLIREESMKLVNNSNWLDVRTRSEIIEKIRDIHIMIGYPDWYDDNGTAIINYYAKLVPGKSHFENTLNNIKFMNEKNLAELHQPTEKYKWSLEPFDLNGIYQYYYNSILVTMAFAQSPIYSVDLPSAVKYGLLGSIIGHEIFHSVDTRGLEYDKNSGKFVSPAKTINKYKNKIQCIINQYNDYTFSEKDPITNETIEIEVKGNVTKNEDMADIEGVRAAFATYRVNLKNNEPSRLIGLEEFNSDKLFFISYANKWCHEATAQWWKDNYGNNYSIHSPSRIRVNRPMSNFKEFAKTFNCPIDNKMNPSSKCTMFGDV